MPEPDIPPPIPGMGRVFVFMMGLLLIVCVVAYCGAGGWKS